MKRSLLVFAVIVCFIIDANAQVINVPVDHSSIQAAIEAAVDGDTVLVAEDTYYENINFRGKPITVASHFILDGDTSHISKTVIDGSQFTYVDSASTVMMCSGEDTTSVLMGFTITGGKGSHFHAWWGTENYLDFGGGGIAIVNGGGKICHNTIEGHQISAGARSNFSFAGGIYANVNHGHSAIIRNNIIRNNLVTGNATYGAGMLLVGGRIIVENNAIIHNNLHGEGASIGAAIYWAEYGSEGVIDEVIFRNNLIAKNTGVSDGYNGFGGTVFLIGSLNVKRVQFHNNVVADNYIDYFGGAILFLGTNSMVVNNTFWNNEAATDGNNISVSGNADIVFYNNIFGSEVMNGNRDIQFDPEGDYNVTVHHNILKELFMEEDRVKAMNNSYMDQIFASDSSFQLAENSPAIGRGIDSLLIDAVWYHAPMKDLSGNDRPNANDPYVDLGAYESEYSRVLLSTADLVSIVQPGFSLDPDFHYDTLEYDMKVPDTFNSVSDLQSLTEDALAETDTDLATDIFSVIPTDRTTTITATSSDGTTQKIYRVEYIPLSTDATLSELSVSQGDLEPEFESTVTFYRVWLPYGSTLTPGVTYTTTHPKATVSVKPAEDITNSKKDITSVIVTSEAGAEVQTLYYIEFRVDLNPPRLSLVNDTVLIDDTIKAISTKNGHIYLLPEQTDAILDSLLIHMIGSTEAIMNDTVLLPTAGRDPGVYWLYAINQYKSVSDAASVTLISSIGIGRDHTASLRFYPTPAEDVLYIETEQPACHSIEITSLNGQLLYNSIMEGTSHQIDLSSFQEGVYLFTIRSKGFVTTRKIVKL